MLNVKTVTPQHASRYYYAEDNLESFGYWSGKGAEELGLEGKIGHDDFVNALHGRAPDGTQIRGKCRNRMAKGKNKIDKSKSQDRQHEAQERAAFDMVFSAPKSISLEILVKGNTALRQAHAEAVGAVTKVIEDTCFYARIQKGTGKQKQRWNEKTGNAIFASFQHKTNRNNDPHWHTHVLSMNATQCSDGKWRSVWNEQFYAHDKNKLGEMYQKFMANKAQSLGYSVTWNDNGTFELSHYTRAQLRAFSTRRVEIEEAAKGNSFFDMRNATLKTRNHKDKKITPDELIQQWTHRALTANINLELQQQKSFDQQLSL